jgi:predicted nucleic acid-binding protein
VRQVRADAPMSASQGSGASSLCSTHPTNMILLETSLLALAYEKRSAAADPRPVAALRRMIHENVALGIPGIVWQELLSDVCSEGQFKQLRAHLAAFPILLAGQQHHAEAARIALSCAAKRIECSPVEALIAAHAVESKAPLFTLNRAFGPIARYAGFKLFAYG